MKNGSLRVALLGTRGIPARYGGFETFAEEISVRLVERGHQVTVYGRHPFFKDSVTDNQEHRGVKVRSTPTIMQKYAETPLHALTSFIDLIRRRSCDVVLLCNAANSPFAWIARLVGVPVIINVDGIERERRKWNWAGRLWYRLGEYCSVAFASSIVADAEVIAAYYRERYGCRSDMIPYGATPVWQDAGEMLARYGLESGRYLLYVSRLEPENNALGVVQAYSSLETEMPLVVVGDAPYAADYIEQVRRAAAPGVIFTGYQFGHSYQELRSHCYLYIQAGEVGGTHPALLEGMAYGNCVLANDVPEHREVLEDCGWYYNKNDFYDLAGKLKVLLGDPEMVEYLGKLAADRAARLYNWERITDAYEQLLWRICGRKPNSGAGTQYLSPDAARDAA